MKTNNIHTLLLSTTLGILAPLAAQAQEPKQEPEPTTKPAATQTQAADQTPAPTTAKEATEKTDQNATPAPAASPGGKGLVFNFHGVPLDDILEYMSEEAGFTIIKKADVRGKVDAINKQPMT